MTRAIRGSLIALFLVQQVPPTWNRIPSNHCNVQRTCSRGGLIQTIISSPNRHKATPPAVAPSAWPSPAYPAGSDVFRGQVAVDAVNHSPHFPRIKKEDFAAAIVVGRVTPCAPVEVRRPTSGGQRTGPPYLIYPARETRGKQELVLSKKAGREGRPCNPRGLLLSLSLSDLDFPRAICLAHMVFQKVAATIKNAGHLSEPFVRATGPTPHFLCVSSIKVVAARTATRALRPRRGG